MPRPTPREIKELRAAYPSDPRVAQLLTAYERCEDLLRRSLYEFGSEIRSEIEQYLGERPLIPPR